MYYWEIGKNALIEGDNNDKTFEINIARANLRKIKLRLDFKLNLAKGIKLLSILSIMHP